MNSVEFFAYLGTFVLGGLTVFQIALIQGAPIGRFSWGGAHDVLPRKLRLASLSSIFLYAIFAGYLLDKAGVANFIDNDNFVTIGMWVMTGYFMLGVIMNALSRSKPERLVMTPTAAILALSFLMVARG